jgi:xanthine dehydrogenase YagS FAD-binding subunit
MQNFEYANPSSLQQAIALLGTHWGDAEVLAGGTELISLMKDELHTPKRVVNIKNIDASLTGMKQEGAQFHIGALVTMDDLARLGKGALNALAQAAAGVPSAQIRHLGTVGGDLCQRPRCWYFRQGYGLLATKDGKPLVPNGENQYHAIFGGGPAYFVSASSLGPALVALNARIKLVSAKGSRELAAHEFFVSPKDNTTREIALRPDEILTEIIVPVATHSSTYEVRQREALDWPLATASVSLTMKGNTVGAARIVMGHVAPIPWESPAAAKALVGKPVNEQTAEAAGKAAVADAHPLSHNAYKVQLAKVAVKRALLDAAQARA